MKNVIAKIKFIIITTNLLPIIFMSCSQSAISNSTDKNLYSVKKTSTINETEEFNSTDLGLFETLNGIAELEQNYSLWDESAPEYKISEMPIYFIHRDDEGELVKAYLLNFNSPPENAIEVIHSYTNLGKIHRYDDEMIKLGTNLIFDFDLDLSGRPTYTIAYKPRNMNSAPNTYSSIPYSSLDVWVDTFIHEGFHHYQFHTPDSNWISYSWGGLSWSKYPVTRNNISLSLLEKHALIAGRDASSLEEKIEALHQILAIRHTRVNLPEAAHESYKISTVLKTHGQGSHAPNGIGQSFTAVKNGKIKSIKLDILRIDSPNAHIELAEGTGSWSENYSQDVVLNVGENIINFDIPFSVEEGNLYSFGLFPSTGFLSHWSASDSYMNGEAFFIDNSYKVGISPSPDLTFELSITGPNYVDLMDRYQERNEGSAVYIARRYFDLSENIYYSQEMKEMLDRNLNTQHQTSRNQLMSTVFQGGWYLTGSTIMLLLDDATTINWKTNFPQGSSPIEILETLYGPLSQTEIDQLVEEAKQDYNWQEILDQVNAIPASYLDSY